MLQSFRRFGTEFVTLTLATSVLTILFPVPNVFAESPASEKRLCGLDVRQTLEQKIEDCNESVESSVGVSFSLVSRNRIVKGIEMNGRGREVRYYENVYNEIYRDSSSGMVWSVPAFNVLVNSRNRYEEAINGGCERRKMNRFGGWDPREFGYLVDRTWRVPSVENFERMIEHGGLEIMPWLIRGRDGQYSDDYNASPQADPRLNVMRVRPPELTFFLTDTPSSASEAGYFLYRPSSREALTSVYPAIPRRYYENLRTGQVRWVVPARVVCVTGEVLMSSVDGAHARTL